ncbi:MAG: NAD(P)/FAD-dependent oxidoreductase [Gemmatimonadota bacterium]
MSAFQHDHEVVVVGAGPAGSFTALRLAELGHQVALVDKNATARFEIVCSGIIGCEAYEQLELPRKAVIDTVRRVRVFSPAGVQVTYEPPKPLAHVVDRTKFDGALAALAREAGVTLIRGWAACGVEKSRDGVTLTIRNGRTRSVRARALVVATGHQRFLHKAAGLGRPPGYVHGVHVDLPFVDLDSAELYFGNKLAPGYFAWAVPFGRGTARLGVLAPQGARRLFQSFLERESIRTRLQTGSGSVNGKLLQNRLQSRGIVQGLVSPSFADFALAVGEAAGQVKTTTAGGIYYGIIGAEIAAEVLSDGLRQNRLRARDLRRYEEAWVGRLGSEIRTGLELQRLALSITDPEIDALFGALQNGLGSALRQVVRFDWHRPALKLLFKSSRAWRLGTVALPSVGIR